MIADKMNYPFPQKVYPKLPLVVIAFLLDKFYKVFSLKTTPKINMRLIGLLSNRAKHYNGAAIKDLGWDHKVSIPEGIDKALAWQMNNLTM
jgi:nucleoside-diphosphate-sugar epimerase